MDLINSQSSKSLGKQMDGSLSEELVKKLLAAPEDVKLAISQLNSPKPKPKIEKSEPVNVTNTVHFSLCFSQNFHTTLFFRRRNGSQNSLEGPLGTDGVMKVTEQ